MEENANEQQNNISPDTNMNSAANANRVRNLFEWKSLNRPAWTYSRDVFTTLGALCLLLSIIFIFFQEWLAIVVTWAAFFLFYALSRVPPVEVEHKITTEGIVSMGQSYLWIELGPFWFSEKGTDTQLHIAHRNIFGQLILLINKDDKEKIRDVLAGYLPYVEAVQKTTVEKMQDWFSKKFPLTKIVSSNASVAQPQTPPA